MENRKEPKYWGGVSSYLPTASTTKLGGVKIDGTTITINNGVISAQGDGNGADWDAVEGENGFIDNKPFDVPTGDDEPLFTGETLTYDEDAGAYFKRFDDQTFFDSGDLGKNVNVTLPNTSEISESVFLYDNLYYSVAHNFDEETGEPSAYPSFIIETINTYSVMYVWLDGEHTAGDTITASASLENVTYSKLSATKLNIGDGLIADGDTLKATSTITIDSALSTSSTNPVQNKVITNKIAEVLGVPQDPALPTYNFTFTGGEFPNHLNDHPNAQRLSCVVHSTGAYGTTFYDVYCPNDTNITWSLVATEGSIVCIAHGGVAGQGFGFQPVCYFYTTSGSEETTTFMGAGNSNYYDEAGGYKVAECRWTPNPTSNPTNMIMINGSCLDAGTYTTGDYDVVGVNLPSCNYTINSEIVTPWTTLQNRVATLEYDYIIDEGTTTTASTSASAIDGNQTWHYIKYKSGLLKAWSEFAYNLMAVTQFGAIYETSAIEESSPSIFVTIQNIIAQKGNGTAGWLEIGGGRDDSTHKLSKYYFARGNSTSITSKLNIEIIGTWK